MTSMFDDRGFIVNDPDQTRYAICKIDFCSRMELKRLFTNEFLAGAYVCAAGLFVLYFASDRYLCHRNRLIESLYKSFIIVLVLASTWLWENSLDSDNIYASGAIHMRSASHFIMAIYLVMRFASPSGRLVDSFFSRPGARQDAKRIAPKFLPPPPRGARIATELNEEILRSLGTTVQGTMDVAVCPALFACFMLEELALAFPNTIRDFVYYTTNLISLLSFALTAYWAVWISILRPGHVRAISVLLQELLQSKEPESVSYAIERVNVGTLLMITAIDKDLVNKALEDRLFNTMSKAILIDGFQKAGLSRHIDQEMVKDVIVSCEGSELTNLKMLIDGGGNYNNLFKLVYEDIRSLSIQEAILEHLEEQARIVRQEDGRCKGIKVLSDVDDTLYSSGGKFPAGCDAIYPKHAVYPGCLSLYRALDKDFSNETPSCNLVFLSARPHVYKDVSEDLSYQLFSGLVDEGRMHCRPTLLPGKLISGVKAMILGKWHHASAWQQVGQDKFDTYKRFRQLYLEYDFVFIGDNGQGDLLAGQLMLAAEEQEQDGDSESELLCGMEEMRPRLKAVLIHEVLPEGSPLTFDPADDCHSSLREILGSQKLLLHKTYLGAAVDLHSLDSSFFNASALRDVAKAAIEEFDTARLLYPTSRWSKKKIKAAENDLNKDLQRANVILQREFGETVTSPLALRSTTRVMRLAEGISPLSRTPTEGDTPTEGASSCEATSD